MQLRKLGNDIQISAVGLGYTGLSHAFGVPREKSKDARKIQAAYDNRVYFL